jgi:hypothetical protein
MNITTNYNIEKLEGNLINNYQYDYVDSVDGNLTMHDNRWFANLNFYIIMNANLPMNMLTTSVVLPYASVENISLD